MKIKGGVTKINLVGKSWYSTMLPDAAGGITIMITAMVQFAL